jgi:putative heme-binding domain-containing protein
MSEDGPAELVAHLSHANGWWRDTAQRLLVEERATEAAGALRELATSGEESLGRMHALWTLEGIEELDWKTLSKAIGDEDAMVRATAIRLSERFVDEVERDQLWARLASAFDDERPMVRLQLLLTLGEWKGDEEAEAEMARILGKHPSQVFGTAAVSGLGERELEFIALLLEDGRWSAEKERGTKALRFLSEGVANEGSGERVARLLELADAHAEQKAWGTAAILSGVLASTRSKEKWPTPLTLPAEPGFLDTLARDSREEWRKSAGRLHRILTWPGDTHAHPKKPVPKPLSALQESRGEPDRLVRIALHGVHGPIQVNGRTWDLSMPGLGNSAILNDERMAAVLTYIRRAWDNHGDAVEPEFVAAVRRDTAGRATPWSAEELLNPEIASKAEARILGDPLAPYRGALESGDPERGREIFHTNLNVRCSACHVVGRFGGGFIGPELSDVGSRATVEYLLESLVVPNAVVVEGYQTMVITTKDGQFHAGTLVSESKKEIVLAQLAGGEVSIPADQVAERVSSAVSTMPPVGTVFTVEEIADLVAYLASLSGKKAKE